MSGQPNITIHEAVKAGFCVAGIRAWCQRNGVSMREAARHGIPPETIEVAGDLAVLERILKNREENDG